MAQHQMILTDDEYDLVIKYRARSANQDQTAPGPWHIRVDQSYARRDGPGTWSLWSDKKKATTWAWAEQAQAAKQRAPGIIQFDGIVERDGNA